MASLILAILLFAAIAFNHQVYIYMFNVETMCFWLALKTLFVWLIYDKIIHKDWVLNILKLPSINQLEIRWIKDQAETEFFLEHYEYSLEIE
jgi:hypothetical protein